MGERWITFLYQYGVGGLVFFGSLVLLWRQGMLGEAGSRRRRWAWWLIVGLAAYALVQGSLQFLGPEYDLSCGGSP